MQREEPSVRRQRRAYSQRQTGKKSNMFTKIRDCDPYFDNYEWGCVSAPFQTQFEIEPCKPVRGIWYDPAHHPPLCSHP